MPDLDVALSQLPAYVSNVLAMLAQAIAAAADGTPADPESDLTAEGLSRIFHIASSDGDQISILRGLYARWLTKIPELPNVVILDTVERELQARNDPDLQNAAAFSVQEPNDVDASGIHVLPILFGQINSDRRIGVLFHEMGHFFFDLDDFDPRPSPLSASFIMAKCNNAFDWFAFQIRLGSVFPAN